MHRINISVSGQCRLTIKMPFLIAVLSIFIFYFLSALITDTAFAAKDPKEEYKKLQKEIDTHKEKLEKAKKMEHSVLEELDRTNKDLSQTQAELRKYIGKRKVTENEIRKVEADIS
ncbi:MAG: hypothetical protein Q8K51_09770, partial [Nitrospirota bacterium]|nr:hypothetical protein [Nitrospirota bacterium]